MMADSVNLYDSTYGKFVARVLEEVRREAFGEDIGQNSWLTADEYRRFFRWLELDTSSEVLEIASGSGGPALFMASETGCRVTGIDNNENGVANANRTARQQGMDSRVSFLTADASKTLPFETSAFDRIVCIDAVNHLPNRARVFTEWHRVLKPGAKVLFTDPIVVTGQLDNEEIAIRSSIGFFLFTPRGANEKLLEDAGFELLYFEDVTEQEAQVSKRWLDARHARRDDLLKIEGEETFEGLQRFFEMVYRLSSERRLSRFVYAARKK